MNRFIQLVTAKDGLHIYIKSFYPDGETKLVYQRFISEEEVMGSRMNKLRDFYLEHKHLPTYVVDEWADYLFLRWIGKWDRAVVTRLDSYVYSVEISA